MPKGMYPRKVRTHCKWGHPFVPENTSIRANGYRDCRACRANRSPKASRKWRLTNPEKLREARRKYDRKWERANPEKVRFKKRRQRACKREADAGLKLWMIRYYRFMQRGCCCYCERLMFQQTPKGHPRKETLEHLIPLSRGGKHSWDNTALACSRCNAIKGARIANDRAVDTRINPW